MGILDLLLGRRLANRESEQRKIGAFEGLPVMGLDGLGSSAYGPEAALTVLIPLGAASLSVLGWIMAPIVALLAILFASYWQTVRAYPNNGGAYVVAKENLGPNAGLLAAAALMIDYVLNVAVGLSAGVGALVSALPSLHPYILPICLGLLAFITLVNLRGTVESGRLFAVPTYLFIASFMTILGIGLYQAIATGGHPVPVVRPPALPEASASIGLWLLLRAFASGCTAMTGVEAVSNGMSAFRDPPVRYGHRTLTLIVVVLGILLVGITALARAYGIGAMDQTQGGYRSVLSQLAAAVVGSGFFYDVAIGSLLCVLTLSANTSFAGLPQLCRLVADDGFLPKPFAIAGRRLVFSIGIFYLAGCAGLLLIVFGGITDRLIPLFAIGAFLTFTLSQAGMVVHGRRDLRDAARTRGFLARRAHLWINAIGAVLTGIALVIIVVAKFAEGAWITVLVIPAAMLLLKAVRRYYDDLDAHVRDADPLDLEGLEPPIVAVAIESWDKLSDNALTFAMSLSPDVVAVHLTRLSGPESDEHRNRLLQRWSADVEAPARRAGRTPPRLMILEAERRAIHEPILRLVQELAAPSPRRRIAVMVPELVKPHWIQQILHSHRARSLRAQLIAHGTSRVMVISVPWHLERAAGAGSSSCDPYPNRSA